MSRKPVTVTVRIPVEVTLVCTVRVTRGHPGTMYARNGDPGDPPDPDEFEVVEAHVDYADKVTLAGETHELVSDNEDSIYEKASDAAMRSEG